MHDLGLAIVHHLLVFGLVAMLASERTLLKASAIDVKRLARLDGGYGLTAALVVVVGAARAVWGGKGWVYYADNPYFWGKMGVFTAIGLLSVGPTMMFLRWAKQAKADAAFQPEPGELKRARAWVGLELLLILPLVALAAAMARWPF